MIKQVRLLRHFKEFIRDYRAINKNTDSESLELVINWLLKSQLKSGGFSSHYSLTNNWGVAFPETTGYIIETLVNYYKLSGNEKILESISNAISWLLSVQFEDGSIPDRHFSQPVIFDTGQVLHGLCSYYSINKSQSTLKAINKASSFLRNNLDSKGYWKNHTLNNQIHTYNTRTAWALLESYLINDNSKNLDSAKLNLDWALSIQETNGFFPHNSFSKSSYPLTHTIAYTLRGLLEGNRIIGDSLYLDSVMKAIKNILKTQRTNGSFPGLLSKDWVPKAKWSCLTGDVQLAIILLKLYVITGKEEYKESSYRAINFVKSHQSLSSNSNINGAIGGSAPIYRGYFRFSYPNWAAKFFADSLIFKESFD